MTGPQDLQAGIPPSSIDNNKLKTISTLMTPYLDRYYSVSRSSNVVHRV